MAYLKLFLGALLLTVLIESLTAAALRKFAGRPLGLRQISLPLLLGVVALASCFTLPYVWFVLPSLLADLPRWVFGALAEMFVLLLEMFWYRLALPLTFKQALLLSLAANLASFLTGLFFV
jgi:hypothetical protein